MSLGYILWGPQMCVQNSMAIHPVVGVIFQSGPIDRQTIYGTKPLAWPKQKNNPLIFEKYVLCNINFIATVVYLMLHSNIPETTCAESGSP